MAHSTILKKFNEDQLNREPLANYLTSFILTAIPTTNEKSIVIALDSPWGSGKSSFINMWTNSLNPEDFVCINYNAWENDDFADALTPFICSIQYGLGENRETTSEILSVYSRNIFSKIVGTFIGIDLVQCLKESKEEIKKITDVGGIFEDYESRQNKKNLFTKLILDVKNSRKKVIICIDELDRCKPTFAIETLEIIKHFFDIDDVIFVFSLDMGQLKNTICNVYGDIDGTAYLQRFFDYHFTFTKPDLREYLSTRLKDGNGGYMVDIDYAVNVGEYFSISLRTLNVICEEFQKFIKQKLNIKKTSINPYGPSADFRKTYFTLFSLKYTNPIKYLEYTDGCLGDQSNSLCGLLNDVYYNKSIADGSIFSLYKQSRGGDGNTHSETIKKTLECFVYDNEMDSYEVSLSANLSVKEMIRNNIVCGVMFPEHTNFVVLVDENGKNKTLTNL